MASGERELEASRSHGYQMLPRRCGTPLDRGADLRPPFTGNELSLDVGKGSRVKKR